MGSLTEEQEIELEQAIEENEEGIVGDILERAKNDNEEMDQELGNIRTELEYRQVLSRGDLADRLECWQSLGLPDVAVEGLSYKFDSISWERPVFGEVASREPVESKIARIAKGDMSQELVFDPEFLLFGPKVGNSRPKLAGLPPWINSPPTRHGKHRIQPYSSGDLIGKLLRGLARLRQADFISLPISCCKAVATMPQGAQWLLFCTHPIREAENTLSPNRPFLTIYAFPEIAEGNIPVPINPEGADAETVHEFLVQAEGYARTGALTGLTDQAEAQAARNAGKMLKVWIESVTKFGAASFLEEAKYFVPIPVALVRIFA